MKREFKIGIRGQGSGTKGKSGQTLVEVVVAVGVVVLLAVSLVTTSLVTQKTARSARNNTQATKLAQQYAEKIRVIRDRQGFSALTTAAGGSCRQLSANNPDPLNWTMPPCSVPIAGEVANLNNTIFYQTFTLAVDPSNSNLIEVNITVTWKEQGGTFKVNHLTKLSKWE